MESLLGATLFLILVTASAAQDACICETNKQTVCNRNQFSNCECRAVGSNQLVDCTTLTSKCLLMKAEIIPATKRSFQKPEGAIPDNDGLYNPDCDDNGNFKARQCNQTDTCWCVNSAGVRRTDKGDKSMKCSELVRTNWIFINLKHKEREGSFSEHELANSLRQLIQNRYKLQQHYITAIEYDSPFIHIDLKQNATQKSHEDVDIADVAYYFEKDMKGDSVFRHGMFNLSVNEEPLDIEEILIYYVDEKPAEFSMQRLTPGIIAVVVVVILAIIIGITVFVITRRRSSGKYKKVEIKEMGEMRRGQNS
ncbi:PREDICTED: tumor-associated calcium signal transducer 2 [Gekko japonicus]|uniref:Tumor-associated calcium signal transducer 2 n=1 Tax=Gekko japonicus TaxID=146911 RepID=A0ABM1K3W4_GEKJA|nr:PREDICTED: tumor-associated calcium signal transducer 2 [Gekko japonicus]